MGHFGVHVNPYADGPLVAYKAPGPPFTVWATSLSGERRHREVSTEAGTDITRPAVAGNRVAWSDNRNCSGPNCKEDVFERDPYDVGTEEQLSSPNELSRTPDVDGTTTVWNCDNSICVHNGVTLTLIDLSSNFMAPTSTVGNIVRFSTPTVVWHEATIEDFSATDARIHALNMLTGDDEILADGPAVANEFPDFDIDGTTVIWANPPWVSGVLYKTTVVGCGLDPSPCDHTVSATVFEDPSTYPDPDHVLFSPSIDGGRVAWKDCIQFEFNLCDIYTRTLVESDRHLVTNAVPNLR